MTERWKVGDLVTVSHDGQTRTGFVTSTSPLLGVPEVWSANGEQLAPPYRDGMEIAHAPTPPSVILGAGVQPYPPISDDEY